MESKPDLFLEILIHDILSSKTLEIFTFLRKIYNQAQDNNEQSDILAEIRDALLTEADVG